jgi:hypothetical protein
MKTFIEHLQENINPDITALNEALQEEWSPELEKQVDMAIAEWLKQYTDESGKINLEKFNEEVTNEGFLGTILGGLTGFALGKSIGKIIANVLGINSGVLFDLLTSRLVGAALGSALGSRVI